MRILLFLLLSSCTMQQADVSEVQSNDPPAVFVRYCLENIDIRNDPWCKAVLNE